METQSNGIEAVTISDILELATWNRDRSDDELRNFVNSRHASLPDNIDIE